jgi:hypothetical protein
MSAIKRHAGMWKRRIALIETPVRRSSHPGHARVLRGLPLVALLAGLLMILTAASYPSGVYSAYASLQHSPSGYTRLSWNPQTRSLSVYMWLTGLAPNSSHPAHIHTGSCAQNGPIRYMLSTVYADSVGNAQAWTMISNVSGGIPYTGWSINVHNGPGLGTTDQFEPIVCGNLYNSYTYPGAYQYTGTYLYPTSYANQASGGYAQLWISGSSLYTRVVMWGLAPGSVHAAHIHLGSCSSQGGIAYMLRNVVANSYGYSDETTVSNGVTSIPTSGWYVNVHRTTNLSTQTGFDPIACGDVYP